ncbi:YihY/virulence factor BrkB family protein [Alteribacter keqinensis]|uniref:YihY/virulence factor BrkB family protein n=1 Tax=Alteribacter keqinensis TaxID=2483800 RepID=A0A3M7TMA1_9BACI|nr:YihY/virulence factor BrkB family protein [Alteribacter keqinensis]RNA66753.1 YihY/virulence factor BrkB family protein [Alteribacter keqinensis]
MVKWITQFFHKLKEGQVIDLSAQLAFYFLLMFVPFLLFGLALLSFFPIDGKVLLEYVSAMAPGEVGTIIARNEDMLLGIRHGGFLSFGLLLSVFATTNSLHATIRALNLAHHQKEERSFLRIRMLSLFFAILIIAAILIQLILPFFIVTLDRYVASVFHIPSGILASWEWIVWFVSTVTVFGVLVFLYKLGPNVTSSFKQVVPGAIFATLGWQVTSFGMSLYVQYMANLSALHGTLSSVIILIIWFYLVGFVLLTGGLINAMETRQDPLPS